jgi:carbonic anhydrase
MHHSRSTFLTAASALLLAAPAGAASPARLDEHATCPAQTWPEAKQRLVYGNRRFVSQTAAHPNQTVERRVDTVPGQCPFALVLTCADSRVPPDVVFDRGLGDLFVCRTAGNVADAIVIGSLQYAVLHYHPPLLVVLGHENCGAVGATLDWLNGAPTPPPSIYSVVAAVSRGVHRDMNLEAAVKANAAHVARTLKDQPQISALHVVSAYYSMTTGHVTFF